MNTNEMMGQWLMGLRQKNMLGDDVPTERGQPKTDAKKGTVVASADGDLAATVAASLAAKAKAAPKEETPEEPPPPPPDEWAEIRASMTEWDGRLERLAKKAGIRLDAPPPEPEITEAQRKADQAKELLDRAVAAASEKRDQKARRRAAKALSKLGLR